MKEHPMAAYWRSPKWIKLKADLITIRGLKCEWCGKKRTASGLVPHHLTYENFKQENPDDIVLICKRCHAIEHGKIRVKVKRKRLTSKERMAIKKKKRELLNLLPKKKKPLTAGYGVKRVCPKCGKYLKLSGLLWKCECGYEKERSTKNQQKEQLEKTILQMIKTL